MYGLLKMDQEQNKETNRAMNDAPMCILKKRKEKKMTLQFQELNPYTQSRFVQKNI